MQDLSTYIDYLPPVLWESAGDEPGFLDEWLRIFEKILTGIDDSVRIPPAQDAARHYAPLAQTITMLPELANPWRTPSEMLPYLAAWFGLEFTEKRFGAKPDEVEPWSDYQKRKLLADISLLHSRRGSREGLYLYLDRFLPQHRRPRIVIDTGETILTAHFAIGERHQLEFEATVVTSLIDPLPGQNGNATPVVVRPVALAVDSGNLIVVDLGTKNEEDGAGSNILEQIVIWNVPIASTETERVRPTPIWVSPNTPDKPSLNLPVALVVYAPGQYLVLDNNPDDEPDANKPVANKPVVNKPKLYKLQQNSDDLNYSLKPVKNVDKITALNPIDMILYKQDDAVWLLILDKGSDHTLLQLFLVKIDANMDIESVKPIALSGISRPTALALYPDHAGTEELHFLVADAAEQKLEDSQLKQLVNRDQAVMRSLAPELYKIVLKLSDGSIIEKSALLDGLLKDSSVANPLVYPTGLAFTGGDPNFVLVCDLGIKDGAEGTFGPRERTLATQPMIYLICLKPPDEEKPNTFTSLGGAWRLVRPTKMVWDGDALYIANAGEQFRPAGKIIDWRVREAEFGVVVHFSSADLEATSAVDKDRNAQIDGIWRQIEEIVSRERPAHTHFWMVSPKSN